MLRYCENPRVCDTVVSIVPHNSAMVNLQYITFGSIMYITLNTFLNVNILEYHGNIGCRNDLHEFIFFFRNQCV
jgi:hypothetical protein